MLPPHAYVVFYQPQPLGMSGRSRPRKRAPQTGPSPRRHLQIATHHALLCAPAEDHVDPPAPALRLAKAKTGSTHSEVQCGRAAAWQRGGHHMGPLAREGGAKGCKIERGAARRSAAGPGALERRSAHKKLGGRGLQRRVSGGIVRGIGWHSMWHCGRGAERGCPKSLAEAAGGREGGACRWPWGRARDARRWPAGGAAAHAPSARLGHIIVAKICEQHLQQSQVLCVCVCVGGGGGEAS